MPVLFREKKKDAFKIGIDNILHRLILMLKLQEHILEDVLNPNDDFDQLSPGGQKKFHERFVEVIASSLRVSVEESLPTEEQQLGGAAASAGISVAEGKHVYDFMPPVYDLAAAMGLIIYRVLGKKSYDLFLLYTEDINKKPDNTLKNVFYNEYLDQLLKPAKESDPLFANEAKQRLYIFHDMKADADDGVAISFLMAMAHYAHLELIIVSGANRDVLAEPSLHALQLENVSAHLQTLGYKYATTPTQITYEKALTLTDHDYENAWALQISRMNAATGEAPAALRNIAKYFVEGNVNAGKYTGYNLEGTAEFGLIPIMEALDRCYPIASACCCGLYPNANIMDLAKPLQPIITLNAVAKLIGRCPVKFAGKYFDPLSLIDEKGCMLKGTGANWKSFLSFVAQAGIHIKISENSDSAEMYMINDELFNPKDSDNTKYYEMALQYLKAMGTKYATIEEFSGKASLFNNYLHQLEQELRKLSAPMDSLYAQP